MAADSNQCIASAEETEENGVIISTIVFCWTKKATKRLI